jgi:hypothetical protein
MYRLPHPQLLLLRVRRLACDAAHFRPRITPLNLASTIWQTVHPLRRSKACELVPMAKRFPAPLIRRLRNCRD